MGLTHLAPLAAVLALLTGCNLSSNRERLSYLEGPRPALDQLDLRQFAAAQNEALHNLATLAGLPPSADGGAKLPPPGDANWALVADAGVLYVNQVCDRYMDSLFWFNRWKNSAKSGLALTGAATTAAMGIFGASANAIAALATAFGLGTGLIDTGSASVLYSIDPSALRVLLNKALTKQRELIAQQRSMLTNAPSTLLAVQGYLAVCLPANLETMVNTAVNTATVDAAVPGTTEQGSVGTLVINPAGTPVPMIREPLRPTPALRNPVSSIPVAGPATGILDAAEARRIAAALCLAPEDGLDRGPRLLGAIRSFKSLPGHSGPPDRLSITDTAFLKSQPPCDRIQYENPFEAYLFPDRAHRQELQVMLNDRAPPPLSVAQTGSFDPPFRAALAKLQAGFAQPDTGSMSAQFLAFIGNQPTTRMNPPQSTP